MARTKYKLSLHNKAIINRLHTEIYTTAGAKTTTNAGTFDQKLDRILERKPFTEVFSPTDSSLLHPNAATFSIAHDDGWEYPEWTYLKHCFLDEKTSFFSDYLNMLAEYQLPFEKLEMFLTNFEDNYNSAKTLKEIFSHPYWDRYSDELKKISGHFKAASPVGRVIQERANFLPPALQKSAPIQPIKALDVDTLTLLVMEAQETGNIRPLQKVLNDIELRAESLGTNVVRDVNEAYREVSSTFWNTREFVNAIRPGTYAYPVQKTEAVNPLSLKGLLQVWSDVVTPKPPKSDVPQLDAFQQYKLSTTKIRGNIEKIDEAVASLYEIIRTGGKQVNNLQATEDTITSFLDSDNGKALLANDSAMLGILTAAQSRMKQSCGVLEHVGFSSNGFVERIMPMRQTLSAMMGGVTWTMTGQTANVIVDNEGYKNNFHRALVEMADINAYTMTNFAIQASILKDTGTSMAAELAKDANLIKEATSSFQKRLKESGDPTTPLFLPKPEESDPNPAPNLT